jgi:DNA processing protein
MNDLKYWIAFNNIEGLGSVSIIRIWKHFQSIKEAWSASSSDLHHVEGIQNHIIEKLIKTRNKINPDEELEKIQQKEIKILCLRDPEYPALLKQIYDPPVILYYRGNITETDLNRTIALVGTRTPTTYGREMSRKLSKELTRYGITIVSGLAEGIDTCAHSACIEEKGKTLAVIGSGLDVIYPKSNRNLYKQIIENNSGAVISEYPPDSPPDSWKFPYRNRIVSGLSAATIVVESKGRGGALITAKHALEQNREVFGVSSRVNNNSNDGVHNLIYHGEARIFTTYKSLFDHLNWQVTSEQTDQEEINSKPSKPQEFKSPKQTNLPTIHQDYADKAEKKETISETREQTELNHPPKLSIPSGLTVDEQKVIEALGYETLPFDKLLQKLNIPAPSLLGIMTMLELKNIVSQVSGKRYKRKVQ